MSNICMIAYSDFNQDARIKSYIRILKKAGHCVDLLTLKDASGKTVEHFEGYSLYRLSGQYRGGNPFLYIYSYLKFFLLAFLSLNQLDLKKKYTTVHVHNMPNFLVFAAVLQRLRGKRVVLDIPEEEYPFYRVGVLRNYADDLAPFSETLLCVEYGANAENNSDERRDEQIREAALGLRKLKIVPQDIELRHIYSGGISPAYCIYDPERIPAVETIRHELQPRGIHFLGRFGLWYYNSAGQAIRAGFDLAKAIRPILRTNTN